MNLSRLFDEMNRQFFRGRLPKYRIVFSRQSRILGGICIPERRLIRLHPGLLANPAGSFNHPEVDSAERIRRVLLHEMCHIGRVSHAKRWQAKMLRLADMGEMWAVGEVEEYRKPTDMDWHGGIGQIKDVLIEWANMKPRPDFRDVKRGAARIMLFARVSDVDRSLPWLRAAWRNACREADAEAEARKRFLGEA